MRVPDGGHRFPGEGGAARRGPPDPPPLATARAAVGKRGFSRCTTGFYTVYCHLYAEAYRYFASAFGELMPLVSLLPTGI